MRKNFGAKAWTYPQPVFIIAAYDENGTPDAMNAAWGGISDSEEISICLSAGHKTVKNILTRKAFTISMATAAQAAACDYVGIVSANQVPDKFQRAGFHAEKASQVDAPLIRELPMALECELVRYDPGTGRMVGRIVNVCADEAVLDETGKIDPEKLEPIVFDPVTQYLPQAGRNRRSRFSGRHAAEVIFYKAGSKNPAETGRVYKTPAENAFSLKQTCIFSRGML